MVLAHLLLGIGLGLALAGFGAAWGLPWPILPLLYMPGSLLGFALSLAAALLLRRARRTASAARRRLSPP